MHDTGYTILAYAVGFVALWGYALTLVVRSAARRSRVPVRIKK